MTLRGCIKMQIDLPAKSVFVFDWDGTLFDSMAAKTVTFGQVLSAHPALIAKGLASSSAEAIYRKYSGKPRREIFITAATEYGVALTDIDVEAMSRDLTELNRKALVHSTLFPDAIRLLDFLVGLGRNLYISSSVPRPELAYFVSQTMPIRVLEKLNGVFGSSPGFSKGPEHLAHIVSDLRCSASECVVFGDDMADLELSQAAGVDCLLVDRAAKSFDNHSHAVSSLDEVRRCLK